MNEKTKFLGEKTIQYKRTIKGSVGAGVGSLLGAKGRRYYILEHKEASKYHKAGESQKIIIDQVELGRSAACQVRFDESFSTVSRRHAAIVKEGNGWKLVQLSTTNTTFLNGRPVETEWYLQNGDEIQLSVDGPKLGFIVPAGKQSLVSSIKMTERLELFRKQALRPYKTAICILCAVLLILSAGGGYKLYDLHCENLAQEQRLQLAEENHKKLKAENDTLQERVKESTVVIGELRKKVGTLAKNGGIRGKVTPVPQPPVEKLRVAAPHVFFVRGIGYEVIDVDGTRQEIGCGDKVPGWSGTGFLLADGKFVTARHVVEPWAFIDEEDEFLLLLNAIANSGGKVVAHMVAKSSTGAEFRFTTSQFVKNSSHDKTHDLGDGMKLSQANLDWTDYAYVRTGQTEGLSYDPKLSRSLQMGMKLHVLGFPLSLGASGKGVKSLYSTADVAQDGVYDNGYILTTATGFEHGNSGGPVFVEEAGKMTVVGIVSAGAGRSTGCVIPISVVQ